MEVRGGGHASHLAHPPAPEPPPPAPAPCSQPGPPSAARMLSERAVPQRPPLKQRPRGESHRIPGNPAKVGQRTKGGGVRPLQPLSPELGCGSRLSVGSQLRSEASFLLRSLHQGLVAPQDEVQSLAWLARPPGTQCWPASPASSPRLSEVRSIEACPHPTVSLPKPSRLPLIPKASPACPNLTRHGTQQKRVLLARLPQSRQLLQEEEARDLGLHLLLPLPSLGLGFLS